MALQCCVNFITFLLLIFMYFANPVPTPTSGPFRSNILSVKDCVNVSRPWMKNPPIVYLTSVINRTGKVNLLFQKFTVVRETKNVKYKIKSFLWRNGQWKLNNLINNVDCHGMLLHMITLSTKVKYDRRTCTNFKGSYSTTLEINTLQHTWTSKLEYGRLMWTVEATISAGTIFCKEFYTIAEPEFE